MLLTGSRSVAQHFSAAAEIQSRFIDITGLFGVAEPAMVSNFSYGSRQWQWQLSHAFSVRHFGKTIQTIVTPSYTFPLDTTRHWFIKAKTEIVHNEPAGGAFMRPGIHFLHQTTQGGTLNIEGWAFYDLREQAKFPQRLNGYTAMASYAQQWQWRNWAHGAETKFLYVRVAHKLSAVAVLQQAGIRYKPWKIALGANAAFSLHRSDGAAYQAINFFVSKSF